MSALTQTAHNTLGSGNDERKSLSHGKKHG